MNGSKTAMLKSEAYLELADGTRWPLASPMQVRGNTETVTVGMSREPQANWSDVDPNGHAHHYVRDEQGVPRLPSLERRYRKEECPGGCGDPDCDGVSVEEWFCRICGEQVKPGFRTIYDKTVPVWTDVTYDLRVYMPPPSLDLIEGARYVQITPDAIFRFGEAERAFELPSLNVVSVEQQIGRDITTDVVLVGHLRKRVKTAEVGP